MQPTFFEITTALALAHFQEQGAEVVVLETGHGRAARCDEHRHAAGLASSRRSISIISSGSATRSPEIAAEKAGIIKPGVPVVSAPQPEEVLRRHSRISPLNAACRCILSAAPPCSFCTIGLAGQSSALECRAGRARAGPGAALRAPRSRSSAVLREVEWPGRFQQIHDRLVLDGAHNPAAARRLAETWREVFRRHAQATLVLGVLADKDAAAICAALAPVAARFIPVTMQNPRSLSAEQLQRPHSTRRAGLRLRECA